MDRQDVDEYELPRAEALLAGTLALMTAYARGCCRERRAIMAGRIAANLSSLVRHAGLSDPFRAALGKLHAQWEGLSPTAGEPFSHAPPSSVQ